MSEFRIEKVRHQLEVTLTTGERLVGTVFLESVARNRAGAQDPRGLLNDPAAFFPFEVGDLLVLIAKDQVKIASHAVNAEADTIALPTIDIRVSMADGHIVDGAVEVDAPSDAHRLLDFLNRADARFLSMTIDRTTRCLVNRRLISGVVQR